MRTFFRACNTLNEDLLHCALLFASREVLFNLATVSSTINAPATRWLYHRVVLHTPLDFSQFHTTITSNGTRTQLYRDLVHHFVEQLDASLADFGHTAFHKQLDEIFRALRHLHTVSVRTFYRLDRHCCCKGRTFLPFVSICMAQLRSLRLTELSNFDIDIIGHTNVPNLKHLYISTLHKNMRRFGWSAKDTARLASFAALQLPSLRSLLLPNAVLQNLIEDQHAKRQVWPKVQLLATPQIDVELKPEAEGLAVGAALLAVFPELRSLEVQDYSSDFCDEGGIDVLLPNILHLSIVHNTVSRHLLEDDHQVISFELLAVPGSPGRLDRFSGSPSVLRLRLGFRFEGGLRTLLKIVCEQFPNLLTLEVWVATFSEGKVCPDGILSRHDRQLTNSTQLLDLVRAAPSASLPPQLISFNIRWTVRPKIDLERSDFIPILVANHRSLRVFRAVEAHPDAHLYTQPEIERLESLLKLKRDGWVIGRDLYGDEKTRNVGWQTACARASQLVAALEIDTPGWIEVER